MYVYCSDECTRKAKDYNLQERLNKLKEEMLEADRPQPWFKPFYPYWEKELDNFKLLAKIERVEDDEVLCVLDIIKRGDSEYKEFCDGPEKFGKEKLERLLDKNNLPQWLEEQKNGKQKPNLRLPLPGEYQLWFDPPQWQTDEKDEEDEKEAATYEVIYESDLWLKKLKQKDIQSRLRSSYYNIVYQIIDKNEEGNNTHLEGLKLCNKDGKCVLFAWFKTKGKDKDVPARTVLFLLAPFVKNPSKEDIDEAVTTVNIANFLSSEELEHDDLARLAPRSYPSYMVYDEDSWVTLEEEDSNLTLSGEEEKILNLVSTQGKDSLPIFINGRAGSGKSTMLFYLFADYCDRQWKVSKEKERKFENKPHPLFLTYSEALLKEATEVVKKLLNCHSKFLGQRTEDEKIPNVEPFFQPFQKFLLDLLPPEESDRFNREQYISFNKFKELYQNCRLPITKNKNYSPGLCWYVIRTFIKGYDIDEYINPDSYEEVPRDEKTIPEEIFYNVYKTIWEQWYSSLKNEGYWDDQDLIRRVLELKCYERDYTAIFCDESQDFTRLELQLIMQLSIFSKYDLECKSVSSLPFAFAGDPFQTLNPTGFRWERVKSSFYNEVIMALVPANKLKLKMNFQELKINYRSNSPIVKFNNLILLWRRLQFNIKNMEPQTFWQEKEISSLHKFIFEKDKDESYFQNLKKYFDKKPIIILPCEIDGEIDYIKNDEFLCELFPQFKKKKEDNKEGKKGNKKAEDNKELEIVPENIYTSAKAKGLEFPLVILYKFADELAKDEKEKKELWNFDSNSQATSVELEYFLNKLYVAASRPTSDLLVIDSKEGDELLWSASDSQPGNLQEKLEKEEERERWENKIASISKGEGLGVLERRDDREVNAYRLKQKGITDRDKESLRKAKGFFQNIGNTKEVELCEAWTFKFEGKFALAGELFVKRDEHDEAWDCFWEGACWKELKTRCAEQLSGKLIESQIVEFMTQEPKTLDILDSFTKFLDKRFLDELLKKNRSNKSWQEAVREYVDRVSALLKRQQNPSNEKWSKWGVTLDDLAKSGYPGYNEILDVAGECFYKAKNNEGAVRCWELCQKTEKHEYYLAKVEVVGLPQGLEYLEKAKEDKQIVREWETKGKPITAPWQKYVESSLEILHRYEDLVNFLIEQKKWFEAIKAFEKFPDRFQETEKLKLEVVAAIASSNLTPDKARPHRNTYVDFVTSTYKSSNWQQRLTMEEVGTALEKIGELVPILQFYEGFVEAPDSEKRQFARERWIVAKEEQVEYEKGTEGKNLQQRKSELERKKQQWKIEPQTNAPTPLPKPSHPTAGEQLKWKPLGVGVEQLEIASIEVMRMKALQQLTFSHKKTSSTLQVNLHSGRCTLEGKVEMEPSSPNKLILKVLNAGYGCEVFYGGDRPRVELNIKELGRKVTITLED